jgi:hypothetical protein
MTTQEINNERNAKGVFSTGNDVAGWYAISRDGVNMITFHEGKFTFSAKDDVIRLYSEKGFAKRISQLINRGY